MAIKSTVQGSLAFRGDGSAKVKTASLNSSPIVLSGTLSPSITLATPVSVTLISSPQDVTITVALGIITFTFDDPIAEDTIVTVSFWLEF